MCQSRHQVIQIMCAMLATYLGIVFLLNNTPTVQLLFHWFGFGWEQLTHILIYSFLVAYKLNKWNWKVTDFLKKRFFFMFSYILVVSTGYFLLISSCPMLKTGKLHSIAGSAILAKLFKNYSKGAKMVTFCSTVQKFHWLFCVESFKSRHCE